MGAQLKASSSSRGYTPEQVEIIRQMAPTTSDAVIGERLGMHPRKVCTIRAQHGIAACNKAHWSPEKVEQARVWYVEEGLTATEVAKRIGCGPNTIRALKSKRGWVRSPEAYERNRQALADRLRKNVENGVRPQRAPKAEKKPKATVTVLKTAANANEPQPPKKVHNLSKAPVIFKSEVKAHEPLDTRIVREISRRAMTAQSIATVLGEKELTVSMQLSALLHGGQVEVSGEGRNKLWRPSLCALSKFTNRSESMGCGGAVTPAAS